MNELQTINISVKSYLARLASEERSKLNLWYINELDNGRGNTIYASASVPFNTSGWGKSTKSITLNAMMDGTHVGLGGVYSISSVQKTSKYFLGLTSDGVTLSQTLRDNAKEAERLTVSAINTHIQNKTTWTRLTSELTQRNVSKGTLPKYLKDLEEFGRKAGGDTIQLRKLINKANANIANLAKNGAPTQDLRRAYSKVVTAVSKGDISAMNSALQNAIDKKAVYNNARVARTELSRAYSKGFKRQLMDHPDYEDGDAYVQVELSGGHNIVDVCDFVAGADQYNLGDGVYPPNEAPLIPLHPNCLCLYSIVIKEVKDKRATQFSQERGDEWLSTKSDKQKRAIEYSTAHTDFRSLTSIPSDQIKKIK